MIADGQLTAEEAVRAYHGVLQQLGVRPHRSLEEYMVLQTGVMSYGGNGTVTSLPPPKKAETRSNGEPDFGKMTPAEQGAYHRTRWNRILG